jgi:hypothetical protein
VVGKNGQTSCGRSIGGFVAVTEPVLRALERLMAQLKTGEFVLATPSSEVHIYLQRGRFAWATASAHPYEFRRHLQRRCHIDDETMREVIEFCRRERRPLGETLVAWNLATVEDVRASLTHQLRLALRAATAHDDVASLFLERPQFLEYDERLTFSLEELQCGDASAVTRMPPPVPLPIATPAPREARAAPSLLAAAPWLTNVCVFRGGALVEDLPSEPGVARPSPELVQLLDRAGCDFAAVRGASEDVLGARVAEHTYVFASTASLTHSGATLQTLRRAGWRPPEQHEDRGGVAPPSWRVGATAQASWLPELLGYDREILAVAVSDARGALQQAVGRPSLAPELVATWLAERLVPFAELAAGLVAGAGAHFALGDAGCWAFVAPVGTAQHACVLAHRRSPQGLGWAALNAQLRLLGAQTHGGA